MKIALNLSLFIIVCLAFDNKSLSITNYQIKNICRKEKRISNCIKKLQEKRSNLIKGNHIQIPVIPYEK